MIRYEKLNVFHTSSPSLVAVLNQKNGFFFERHARPAHCGNIGLKCFRLFVFAFTHVAHCGNISLKYFRLFVFALCTKFSVGIIYFLSCLC